MTPAIRKRVRARLLGWGSALLLALLTLAVLLALGHRPDDGGTVSAVLSSSWFHLGCFVLACELEYWIGYFEGRQDAREQIATDLQRDLRPTAPPFPPIDPPGNAEAEAHR